MKYLLTIFIENIFKTKQNYINRQFTDNLKK